MLKINNDLCTGCGVCYNSYPDYLEEGEELKAKIKKQPGDQITAQEIVDTCPSQAIILEK